MNPEVKREWINRLRQPQRKQVTGVLESRDGSQCCLGVLCEIAEEKNLVVKDFSNDYITFDYEAAVLPTSVAAWAGIGNVGLFEMTRRSEAPDCEIGEQQSLSALNDTGLTFNQIADMIERFF